METGMAPEEALKRLREGNRRFVAGQAGLNRKQERFRRDGLVTAQAPCAIVLGCSDSRVPAELVFDQGLGDLFVIRVAGNIVAPSQIGSIEYAADKFGTRLVVVMGHSQCGAVIASIDQLEPAKRTARISLEELLTTLQDAAHEKKSWIDDFHDEEVTISTDLYEVILAYQHYRRPSA